MLLFVESFLIMELLKISGFAEDWNPAGQPEVLQQEKWEEKEEECPWNGLWLWLYWQC